MSAVSRVDIGKCYQNNWFWILRSFFVRSSLHLRYAFVIPSLCLRYASVMPPLHLRYTSASLTEADRVHYGGRSSSLRRMNEGWTEDERRMNEGICWGKEVKSYVNSKRYYYTKLWRTLLWMWNRRSLKNLRIKAWYGHFKAWYGRFKAWYDHFKACNISLYHVPDISVWFNDFSWPL